MAVEASDFAIRKRGNILISILWIIVVMSVLVMGLSHEARNDTERTRLLRDRARAYWLARAAVERVKYDFALIQQRVDPEIERKTRFRYDFEGGWAECVMEGRASLMSVNSDNVQMWKQLLKFYGVEDQDSDGIIDAILDWIDPDDEPRMNGAESEHYMSLSPPYQPRNAAFFSIEELLLVRGINEQMFYGTADRPGLKDILNVGQQALNRFDLNTCSEGILRAFLEIDHEQAMQIIARRSEKAFENVQEVMELLPFDSASLLNQYFWTQWGGNEFIIKSTGFVYDSPARYTVEDEVRYTGGGSLYMNLSHRDFSLDHVDDLPVTEGSKDE